MGKEQKSLELRAKSLEQEEEPYTLSSVLYALCPMPILAYHKVDPRRELGITSLPPRRFERQIRFLKHEGYTSISPREILDFRFANSDFGFLPPQPPRTRGEIEDQKSKIFKPILVTFDDGYEGIYTHAYPILREYTSTAIVFVTTGYIGKHNRWDASPGPRFKHLDWAHIREMADDGIWFGSHGVNHTFLTRQSDSAARYEIEASKKELEDGLGRPIHFFSYPYGDYDDKIINLVQEAGYEAAFSLRPELLTFHVSRFTFHVSTNRPIAQNMYALPRIAIYLVDNMLAFKAKIGCVRSGSPSNIQKVKNRLINRCAYASMLARKLRS
jgi:peptidoglycan/xylan/chitin deacetylase (PgdA/CDA1 family)